MKKSNLIFISPTIPDSTGDGRSRRAYNNLMAMADGYHIYLLISRGVFTKRSVPQDIVEKCKRVEFVPIYLDLKFILQLILINFIPNLYFYIFSKSSGEQHVNENQINNLSEIFKGVDFEIIHVFRLYMAPLASAFLEKGFQGKIQMDLDDIESDTHDDIRKLCELNGNPKKAKLFGQDAIIYKNMEKELLPKFDRVFVCKDEDRYRLLEQHHLSNVEVISNVVKIPNLGLANREETFFTFFFIGNLNYYPNADGVYYFCNQILPLIRNTAQRPFKVRIAGAGLDKKIKKHVKRLPEVKILGYVDEINEEYKKSHAVIVPIRAGGGTRIKVIEAFSFQRPVVSTSISAMGFAAQNEKHLLIADTADKFAIQCNRLMNEPELGRRLVKNGYDLVLSNFTPEVIRPKILGLDE